MDRESKDQLLLLSKKIVVNGIHNLLPAVTDNHIYKEFTYFAYNQEKIKDISTNTKMRASYVQLTRCVLRFLSPSCYQNKLWNLGMENGQAVVKFILMLPQLCCLWLLEDNTSQGIFVSLELCFHALALVSLY